MLTNIFPPEKEDQLRTSRAYISISLSNNTSASKVRLLEIIEWARDHVSSFDVVVGDYFHRHNLEEQQSVSVEKALELATKEGEIRRCRIRKLLDSLGLPGINIRMATSLCTHPAFAERLGALEKLWESDVVFQHLIEEGTRAFLERQPTTQLQIESAQNHSRLYQLEELAIFELLAIEGYAVNIYPGAHLPIMKEVVSGNLRESMPLLAKMILVELRIGKGL